MINGISGVAHTPPASQLNGTSSQKPSKPPQSATSDSVHLSSAAQARLAAIQESKENPAQTSQEAAQGDLQAQRLQAKEAKHR